MFKLYDYKTLQIDTHSGPQHAVVAMEHCGCDGWKYKCRIHEIHPTAEMAQKRKNDLIKLWALKSDTEAK